MTERREWLDIRRHETIYVPENIDQAWLAWFNQQYTNQDCVASVIVEDWLEQPEYDRTFARFNLKNEMDTNNDGGIGWEQTISGSLHVAKYLNISHHGDTGAAPVLVLTDASLQLPDDDKKLLADGRVILVRLDQLKKITILPGKSLADL
jgi:hypothetical protein